MAQTTRNSSIEHAPFVHTIIAFVPWAPYSALARFVHTSVLSRAPGLSRVNYHFFIKEGRSQHHSQLFERTTGLGTAEMYTLCATATDCTESPRGVDTGRTK